MASPLFVNAGARSQLGAGATDRTPALPASLVTGNILVATCGMEVNEAITLSGSGWVQIQAQVNRANLSAMWAWRIIDGAEAAPTFTWTTATAAFGQVFQLSGQHGTPFGTTNSGNGTGTTASATAFNTTADESRVLYFIASGIATAIGTPTNYTEDSDNGGGSTQNAFGGRDIATSGSTSGAISVTVGSGAWIVLMAELKKSVGGSALPVIQNHYSKLRAA